MEERAEGGLLGFSLHVVSFLCYTLLYGAALLSMSLPDGEPPLFALSAPIYDGRGYSFLRGKNTLYVSALSALACYMPA